MKEVKSETSIKLYERKLENYMNGNLRICGCIRITETV